MQRRVDSQRSQYDVYMKTPFSNLGLRFQDAFLIEIAFLEDTGPNMSLSAEAEKVCEQINRYCASQLPNMHFDVKLKTIGTAFQRKVWEALQHIPVGEVVTYGELARKLNTSARAVGNACRNNPISVIIPCHRVVARAGIGGFSGATQGRPLNIKKWLLNHEGVHFS